MQKPNDQAFVKMVYLKGNFVLLTILIAIMVIPHAGSTKIAYKKSLYGKSNVLKDKRGPQKATISPKAAALMTTTTATTTTAAATTSTTTASVTTATIVEPTITIVSNNTIALATIAIYSNSTSAATATTSTTAAALPEFVDTPEEQSIAQVNINNTKDDNAGQNPLNVTSTQDINEAITPAPTPSLPPLLPQSPPIVEEIVAAELPTFPEVEPEAEVLLGATSQAVAVVHPTENVSSTILPIVNKLPEPEKSASKEPVPCTCGVFLNSQFKRGSSEQPSGRAVIDNEMERHYPCNSIGQKQCQTKCLEIMVQHLPNSASILCATLDRDCRKERAYLFVKNCRDKWINTNLAAGREYCCKNGRSYPCPMV